MIRPDLHRTPAPTRSSTVAAAVVLSTVLGLIVGSCVYAGIYGRLDTMLTVETGAALGFGPMGALLLWRRGWGAVASILALEGLAMAATTLASTLTDIASSRGPLHGATLGVAWVDSVIWLPGVALVVPLTVYFPERRRLGRADHALLTVTAVLTVLTFGWHLFQRGPLDSDFPPGWADNPVGFLPGGPLVDNLSFAVFLSLFVLLALALVGLLRRRRRTTSDITRAQYTCYLYGGVLTLVQVIAGQFLPEHATYVHVLSLVGFLPPPVAVAVAVLRYRLYDLGRVVSRTVAYLLVLGLLAGVYIGVLAGVAALVPTDYGQLGVAAATLAVTVLAVPLTRRVRRTVDRRFDRRRYDTQRTVASFAAQLRQRPEAADVNVDLLGVVVRTVQPSHASVWLVTT